MKLGGTARKGVLFQIWRSFIVFILVPIVCLNLVITFLLYDMQSTARELAGSKLSQAKYFLNQNVNNSLAAVEKSGNNYAIQRLAGIRGELQPNDYNILLDARKYRQGEVLGTEAYSINILFHGNDIYMAENSVCMNLKQFYNKTYRFGTLAYEDIKEHGYKGSHLTFYPDLEFTNGTSVKNGILYTTVLTQYAGTDNGATAIVFFNEENLKSVLGDFGLWDGLAYLLDADGQILYRTGNEELAPVSLPLQDYSEEVYQLPTAIYGKDNYALGANLRSGLQIVTVIPKQSLYMRMDTLKIFIWILNGTTIVMCLFLSLKLAKRRSQILSSTLDMMPDKGGKIDNIFSTLHTSVQNLVDTNTSLQHALGEQKELLCSVFWSRVLSVTTMSDEEIISLAESAGISLKSKAYCLLLIGFGHDNAMAAESWNHLLLKREQLTAALAGEETADLYVSCQGLDQLIILLPVPESERADYKHYTEQRIAALEPLLARDAQILCAGSMLFDHPKEIYNAYTACGNRLNFFDGFEPNGKVVWCGEEGPGTSTGFYYSDELKNQIVLWIKSGESGLVKEGFQRILEENYLQRQISTTMEVLLIAKLKLTLLSAYDGKMKIDLSETFEKIDKIQTDAWLFSYIWRVAIEMCNYYVDNRRSREDGLQKKIITYIEDNFMSYNFGLAVVADHCNLSESYFSQVFKEIIGENFSTYVEKKRMHYAYRLILESELTIDLVAEKTGYSNTNAFRKAYKRFFGVSPSQSRKMGDK